MPVFNQTFNLNASRFVPDDATTDNASMTPSCRFRLVLLVLLFSGGPAARGTGSPAEAATAPGAAPVLAIHGGAGTMSPGELDPGQRAEIEASLRGGLVTASGEIRAAVFRDADAAAADGTR
jgi:hypothetical protein